MTADLVIANGAVRTMDPENPVAQAVAVAGGRILAVGADEEIRGLAGPGTHMMDAGGGSVLPGFVESHMHLFMGAVELSDLHLHGSTDVDWITRELRRFAAANPDRRLLVAQGPDYGIFGEVPPRSVLDEMVSDRPVAMVAHDHHTVWANTAALRAAGVLAGYETPDGHEVVMGEDGLATGLLLEPEAYSPVLRVDGLGRERAKLGLTSGREPDPLPSGEARQRDMDCLRQGLGHAARHGITSIVNMDGNRYTLELLTAIREAGDLTARVRVPFHFVPEMEEADLRTAVDMAATWNDEWLTSGFVKIFMDGVIDSRTAFMRNDYPGQAGWRAHGRFSEGRFAQLATLIDGMGLQIAVHSIGDGATERVLDGYAAARSANGDRDLRHRIEHLELVAAKDFARIGELGVTASVQPPHAPGCAGLPLDPTLSNIGRERWADAFAWQRLAATGAPIALASDWPVSDISVLHGIHAAVCREAWAPDVPDQRFGLDAAIRGYTLGGAYAERTEHFKGSLTAGKVADIVMLDRDIHAVPVQDIPDLSISATVSGGRIVYEA